MKTPRRIYKKNKLIYGHGINDSIEKVSITIDGKIIKCPYYTTWHSMLKRCYDPIEHRNYPNYIGCHCVDEWHLFSKFKEWMTLQDWKGKQLDKDLLFRGNKLYSPETCVFISGRVNAFLTDRKRARGEYALGVGKNPWQTKYRAYCNNPFTNKRIGLGTHATIELAHEAWKTQKHKFACDLAGLEQDSRISDALRNYFI